MDLLSGYKEAEMRNLIGSVRSSKGSLILLAIILALVFPSAAAAQLPCYNIHVDGDDIYCSNWQPNAVLRLRIDPGDFMASILTNEMGFGIFVDVYDIRGGQTVTITDNVSSVTYTVATIVIDKVDTCNDTISGTADPGILYITPWLDNRVPQLSTIVDSTGHWFVDFKTVGFDLLSGDQANAEQRTNVYPIYCSSRYRWTAGDCVGSAGQIVSYAGDVTVNGVGVRDLATLNLQPFDRLRTLADGYVDMAFGDSSAHLSSNSEVRIGPGTGPAVTTLDELYGVLKARVRDSSDEYMEVRTPVCIAGVRGTEMLVAASESETRITMLEHDADISTPDGLQSTVLHELESVIVTPAGIGVPFPISPNDIENSWERIVIAVASPVNLYVMDPLGRHIGCGTDGIIVNEIPGAVYSGPFTVPEYIEIPMPVRGGYGIDLISVGIGEYHLTIAGIGLGAEAFFNEFTGIVEPNQIIAFEQNLGLSDVPSTVKIDIKPGTFPNDINLKSRGVIAVAVLTDGNLDAQTVDRATIRFGATGTEAVPVHHAVEDVDGDGDLDVILHFKLRESGLLPGVTSAYLRGFASGREFEGYDSVRIIN